MRVGFQADLVGYACSHGHGRDARGADQRVDGMRRQPVHELAHEHAARRADTESHDAERENEQRVRVEKAPEGDQYGDVYVDTEKSMEIYREWLDMTRPGPGPNGLRRPLWLARPLKPKGPDTRLQCIADYRYSVCEES